MSHERAVRFGRWERRNPPLADARRRATFMLARGISIRSASRFSSLLAPGRKSPRSPKDGQRAPLECWQTHKVNTGWRGPTDQPKLSRPRRVKLLTSVRACARVLLRGQLRAASKYQLRSSFESYRMFRWSGGTCERLSEWSFYPRKPDMFNAITLAANEYEHRVCPAKARTIAKIWQRLTG